MRKKEVRSVMNRLKKITLLIFMSAIALGMIGRIACAEETVTTILYVLYR